MFISDIIAKKTTESTLVNKDNTSMSKTLQVLASVALLTRLYHMIKQTWRVRLQLIYISHAPFVQTS